MRLTRFAVCALILMVAGSSFASNGRQAKKAAPTLGTVQMPGDNGKLKTIYQLGDKGHQLHFTIDSAKFATQFPAPEDLLVAGPKQRLLVLNLTIQNPLSHTEQLTWSSFRFTVVSPDDENIEFSGALLHATKLSHVHQDLVPAQKLKCIVVIPIFPAGPVPKLIVKRGDGPVLRYDLTGKVGKMTSTFSPDGIDLIDKGPTLEKGASADMGPYTVTFDGMEYSSETLHNRKPGEGEVFLMVNVTFQNPLLKPVNIGWQFLTPELTDANGVKLSWASELIGRQGDTAISQPIAPGESISARYFFLVPASTTPKTFRLTYNDTKRSVGFTVPARP